MDLTLTCRKVIEQLAVPALVVDPAGMVLSASPLAERLLGGADEPLAGRSWAETCDAADLPSDLRDRVGEAVAAGVCVHHRAAGPASGRGDLIVTVSPLREEGVYAGALVLLDPIPPSQPEGETTRRPAEASESNLSDLAERKRTEARLAESEARYRALVEEQTELVTRLGPDGQVLFVNEACCRFFRMTRDEFGNSDMYTLVPEEDRETVREQLSLLGAERPVVGIEHRVIAAGGGLRWVQWTNRAVFDGEGRLIEIRGVGRDVTDRHQAEEALRESRDTAWAILNATSDAAILLEADGTVLAANEAFARKLGRPVDELVGSDARPLIPLEARESRLAHFEEAVRSRLPIRFEDERQGRHFVNAVYPILDPQGRVTRVAAFVQDITDRTRMEQELRESEHRYRSLFEELPVSVWEEDFSETKRELDSLRSVGVSDLGAYLDANPQEVPRLLATVRVRDVNEYTWHLYGANSKEHLLAELDRIVDERVYPRFREQLVALFEGHRSFEFEDTYRTIAGKGVPVAGRLFVPRGHEETLDRVIVALVDITRRKQAEEALRESEARYRGVVDNIGIGIAVIGPNMEVLSANPQMEAWFPRLAVGGPPLCYRVFNEPPGDGLCSYCPTVQTLRDGLVHEAVTDTPSGDETRHYRVIASPLRNASGEVAAAIEMVEDCTERMHAEEALRESEERFRDLVDRSPLGIVLHREGTLLYVNPAELRMLGYDDPSEVLGTSVLDHIRAEHRAEVEHRFDEGRGGVERVYETTVVRRDGSELPVLIQATDATLRDGPVSVAFFLDLTDRRRAEEAQRLAAVGHLAAGVAHEFNNLLAGILMQADRADRTGSESDYRLLAGLVRDTATRGSAVCEDLLEFARPREPRWEPVRLETAIEAALAVAANHVENAGVTVTRQYRSQGRLVKGDAGRLQQVFLNLILNGCEAMPGGGDLAFETSCSPTEDNGSAIVVTITDTGTGIEAETLAHIFEPFFTTKGVRGEGGARGTGLGLSLSHSIVVAHGGTVSVSSSPGAGTTFELRFPAHEGEAAAVVPEVTSGEGPEPLSLRGRRVLLVEDEPITRMVLRTTLESEGCELTTACSAAEATEALRTGAFDVVVCDWLIPDGGGRQVIAAARDRPDPPAVMVITGWGGDAFEDELASLGVATCLRKPFGEEQLRASLREALGER